MQISNLAVNNTVGGSKTTVGACDNLCKIIANNADPVNATSARAGDYIDPTGRAGKSIRGNLIFNYFSIGIDLGTVGSTANDVGDADTGPNNLQNFPIIISVIVGSLNSAANSNLTVEFFRNQSTDTMSGSE